MTLSPQVGAKRPGAGAKAVPEGEGWPGRAGPARASHRRGEAATPAGLPAGTAARLPPAALGLVSPALSGRGVSFPTFRLKRGCLSRSSNNEGGGTERPGGASPSGVAHPAASGREGTGPFPDGAQRAAGPRSGGVPPTRTELPTAGCSRSRSGALTALLLRGRAARRRSCPASRPRGPRATRRASSRLKRPGCRLARPEGRGPAAPRRPPARSPGGRPGEESRAERSGAAVALRPPAVLSRPGSAQGDATRRRLREGLFIMTVSGNNFPRAETGSRPELHLPGGVGIPSGWFSGTPP